MIKSPRVPQTIAVLLLSLAAASNAMAGPGAIGGVAAPSQTYAMPNICPTGSPALSPSGITAILKRQGYFAIRGLRYLKPSANDWRGSLSKAGGRYVATASRGVGIVRWQVSIDACTARVAIGSAPTATRTH